MKSRSANDTTKKKKKLPATTNAHSLSTHYVRDSEALASRCRSRRWRWWLRCRCPGRSDYFLVAFSVAFPLSALFYLRAFSLALALLELQQHSGGPRRADPSSVRSKNERRWRRESSWWILSDWRMRGGRAAGHRR